MEIPLPLGSYEIQGNQTDSGISFLNNTQDQTECCDYFEKGAGYEFSVCEGIGAIIRADLIGGAMDIAWASGTEGISELSPILKDLSSLVDNYCDTRS